MKLLGTLHKDKDNRYTFQYYGYVGEKKCVVFIDKVKMGIERMTIYEVPEEMAYDSIARLIDEIESPKEEEIPLKELFKVDPQPKTDKSGTLSLF